MTQRRYTVKSSDTHWGGLTASDAARELGKLSIYGIEARIFDEDGRPVQTNVLALRRKDERP